MIIQAGEVMVNDEIETRRGRKLVSGDEVNIDGEIFLVEREEDGAGEGVESSEGPEAADAGQ